MVLGGDTLSDEQVRELLARGERYDGILIEDDVNLRIRPPDWPGIHGNHSCDPNLWLTAPAELGARRPIEAGDEVTSDYATYTMAPAWRLRCNCGSALCRGTITGDDRRRSELQERYAGHFATPIARRIMGLISGHEPAHAGIHAASRTGGSLTGSDGGV